MTWKLILLGILGLPLFAALASGVSEGRRGNNLLRSGKAATADSVYVQVLTSNNLEPWIQARLQNNLGIARTRTNRLGMADSAFTHALGLEAYPQLRTKMAYNAGTAALRANRLDDAIAYLRRALILAPDDSLARRNIEIALRRNEAGADQPETPESEEPSAFAQRIKAQADSLVHEQRYLDALDVMHSGAARDSTVLAFQEFMQRLEGVVRIDTIDAETTE